MPPYDPLADALAHRRRSMLTNPQAVAGLQKVQASAYASEAKRQASLQRTFERASEQAREDEEKAAKAKEKADKEAADKLKRERNNALEATFRHSGRPFYVDADGLVQPSQTDDGWQQAQAEKKAEKEAAAAAKAEAAQNKANTKFRTERGAQVNEAQAHMAENDDRVQGMVTEKRRLVDQRRMEVRRLDEDLKATKRRWENSTSPEEAAALEEQMKAFEDDLQVKQAKLRENEDALTAFEGEVDTYRKTSRGISGDLTRQENLLPTLEAPRIESTNAPKPAPAVPPPGAVTADTLVAKERAAAAATPTPAVAQEVRADAILRHDNPEAWKAKQARLRAEADDDTLAQTLEASRTAAEQSQAEAVQLAQTIEARSKPLAERVALHNARQAEAQSKPLSAAEAEQINAESAKLNAEIEATEAEIAPLREKIGVLQTDAKLDAENFNATADELRRRQEAAAAKAKQARAAELAKLEAQPGLAPFAGKLRALDTEAEARMADLRAQWNGEPPAEEVKALETNLAERAQSIVEEIKGEAARRGTAMVDLYQTWGNQVRRSDWRTDAGDNVDARLRQEAAARGLTEQEARTALETAAALDWSQPRAYDTAGNPVWEDARVLPTGEITVNPKYLLDAEGYAEAVKSAMGSFEQEKKALAAREGLAARIAPEALDALRKNAAMAAWLDKNTSGTPLERLDQFNAEMKKGGALNAAFMRFQGGAAGIGTGWLGTLAATTGWDWAHEGAQYFADRSAAWETAGEAAGRGTTGAGRFASKVVGAMPSVLSSIAVGGLLGRTVGALAGGARAVKFGDEAAHALEKLVATKGGLAAASIEGGGQSFGSTYMDALEAWRREGVPEAEARARALTPAILSGVTTATLTAALGGGVEKLLQPSGRAGLRTLLRERLREVGMDVADEWTEELTDTLTQGMIALHTYAPDKDVLDVFQEAWESGWIGAALGGGVSAGRESADALRERLTMGSGQSALPPNLTPETPEVTAPAVTPAAGAPAPTATPPAAEATNPAAPAAGAAPASPSPDPATTAPTPDPAAAAQRAQEVATAETELADYVAAAGDNPPQAARITAARGQALLKIGQGATLEELTEEELNGLGYRHDDEGNLERGYWANEKPGDPASPLTWKKGQPPPDKSYITWQKDAAGNRQIVILESALERLAKTFPAVRAAIKLDEQGRRAQIRGEGQPAAPVSPSPATPSAAPAAGTGSGPASLQGAPAAAQSPTPSPAPGAAAPAPAQNAVPPDSTGTTTPPGPTEGKETGPSLPAAPASGPAPSGQPTLQEEERAEQIGNELARRGLPADEAQRVAASIVARQGVQGNDYRLQMAAPDFDTAMVDEGWTRAAGTNKRSYVATPGTRGQVTRNGPAPASPPAATPAPAPSAAAAPAALPGTPGMPNVTQSPEWKAAVREAMTAFVRYIAKGNPQQIKAATQRLGHLEKLLASKLGGTFDRIRLFQAQGGGGLAAMVDPDGKRVLLVDPLAFLVRGTETKRGTEAMVAEELIHTLALSVMTEAQAIELVRMLQATPQGAALLTTSWQAYMAVPISQGQAPNDPPADMDDGTAYHVAHELIRQLVQDRTTRETFFGLIPTGRGLTTENAEVPAGILDWLAKLLRKMSTLLRKQVAGLPPAERGVLESYVNAIERLYNEAVTAKRDLADAVHWQTEAAKAKARPVAPAEPDAAEVDTTEDDLAAAADAELDAAAEATPPPAKPVKAKRAKGGFRMSKAFREMPDPDNPELENMIVFINRSGRITRPSKAWLERMREDGQTSKVSNGDWDWMEKYPVPFYWSNLVFQTGNGSTIDRALQELAEMGYFPGVAAGDVTPQMFGEKLVRTIEAYEGVRKGDTAANQEEQYWDSRERQLVAFEDATAEGPLVLEAGVLGRMLLEARQNPEAPRVAVRLKDKAGKMHRVEVTDFRLEPVHEDDFDPETFASHFEAEGGEFMRVADITLKDGETFGTQQIDGDATLAVDAMDTAGAPAPLSSSARRMGGGADLFGGDLTAGYGSRAQPDLFASAPGRVTLPGNAPASPRNLEPDRRGGYAGDAGGESGVRPSAGKARGDDGDVGQTGNAGGNAGLGDRPPAGGAAPVPGGRSPDRVQTPASRVPGSPAGGQQPGGSRGIDESRAAVESGAELDLFGDPPKRPARDAVADERESSTPESRVKAQALAHANPTAWDNFKLADADSIARSVPMLLPQQQQDVQKAEQRFFLSPPTAEDPKKGVLFTNGTGTGKTYTGLGIIKRFEMMGKGRVLIVVPSQQKVADWQREGKQVTVKINGLKDTQDVGEDVVVTTYANFRDNWRLQSEPWDLVVYDEAHYLNSNAAGGNTANQTAHELATGKPGWRQMEKWVQAELGPRPLLADFPTKEAHQAAAERYRAAIDDAWKRIQFRADTAPDTKAVFLSATPFAYHKNLGYADGFLFNSPEVKSGGYNEPQGFDRYLSENFGYRMRIGKLTQPEPEVDVGLLERDWAERMFGAGAMTGRMIDVPFDYSREFILLNSQTGRQLDDGFASLGGWKQGEDGHKRWPTLTAAFRNYWYSRAGGYTRMMQFMESIKVADALERIEDHTKLGRKVVLFHSYNNADPVHPFQLGYLRPPAMNDPAQQVQARRDLEEEIKDWKRAHPELVDMDFSRLQNPRQLVEKRFGKRARFFNGEVNAKDRAAAIAAFNDDESGVDVLMVQTDAGKEGISLHDTTGKFQRVVMNASLPVKPTDAIQEEGRIYRIGVLSNAIQEYLVLHTSMERSAFGSKISQRTGTVENMALGKMARTLKDSFKSGYLNAHSEDPSAEQGTGGKAQDAAELVGSDMERAKSYYWSRTKKTSKTKAAEGTDYFATPEPVGLTMVRMLEAKAGEDLLEPSAGHGAIGRFFPDNTNNKFVEPSRVLSDELRIKIGAGKVEVMPFEDLHQVNKFDGVAMNPPFGTAGKLAMEHLAKAAGHLRQGGRVVALIPEGTAMAKRFEQWLYEGAGRDMHLRASYGLPTITFERAGTSVKTRIVVLDKANLWRIESDDAGRFYAVDAFGDRVTAFARDAATARAYAERSADFFGFNDSFPIQNRSPRELAAEKIGELFDELENLSPPARLQSAAPAEAAPVPAPYPAGVPTLPATPPANLAQHLLSGRGAILPTATEIAERTPQVPAAAPYAAAETLHAKRGTMTYVAKLTRRISDTEFAKEKARAKGAGGYWSSFKGAGAIPGFQFESPAKRDEFTAGYRAPLSSSARRMSGDMFGEGDFSLESVTGEQLDAEAARAETRAKIETRQAKPLIGTQGDIGQTDMFGGGDLFSMPLSSGVRRLQGDLFGGDLTAGYGSRNQPDFFAQPSPVDAGAHAAATSPTNDRPEPTEAQKQAGNYALGHVRVAGLNISVENPAGSERKGTDRSGKPWSIQMRDHYGYIKGTEASDGDHLDTFIKPGTAPDWTGPVFVARQVDPQSRRFDEYKVLLGYADASEAEAAYRRNYAADWQGLDKIGTVTLDQFKTLVDRGAFRKAGTADPKLALQAPAKRGGGTETDAEYLAAVERGDMETAQRLVDEAAYSSGFRKEGYHGTHRDFTIFDRLNAAKERIGLKLDTVGNWFTDSPDAARKLYGPKVVRAYLDLKNPLRFDGIGGLQDFRSEVEQAHGSVEAFRKWAKSQGYDGVEISGDFVDGELQTFQIAFDPSQIKSADPVTYDDNGNVIPLSQRFNPDSSSILYAPARRRQPPTEAEVTRPANLIARISNNEIDKALTKRLGEALAPAVEVIRQKADASSEAMLAMLTQWAVKGHTRGMTRAQTPDELKEFTAQTRASLGRFINDKKRWFVPDMAIPDDILAKRREMNIAQAIGLEQALDIGKRSLEGKPKLSDLVVPEHMRNPEVRRRMFLAMNPKIPSGITLADLSPEEQAVVKRLQQLRRDIGLAKMKAGRLSLDAFDEMADSTAHYYEQDRKREGSILRTFAHNLRSVLAQRATAWHVEDTETKDANGQPALVNWTAPDEKRQRWRFKDEAHQKAFYEDFIRRQILAAKDERHAKKYAWMKPEERAALLDVTMDKLLAPGTMTPAERQVTDRLEEVLRRRFQKRKPLSYDEHEKAGLIMDPFYSLARQVAEDAHDNALAEFFNHIAASKDYTADVQRAGYTQIPDSSRFGRLAGRFVRDDVAAEVMQLMDVPSMAMQLYDGLLALFKTGKTVLNPGSHVRNLIGNIQLAALAGNNPLNFANARFYADAARVLRDGGDMLQELYDEGVLGGDYLTAEVRRTLKSLLPNPDSILKEAGEGSMAWLAGLKEHIARKIPNFMKRPGSVLVEGASAAWKWEDDIYKAAAYLKARSLGLNRKQAADHVRKWFAFYDHGQSGFTRALQRFTMPFLSFRRESLRIMKNAIKERPISFLFTMALPRALTQLSLTVGQMKLLWWMVGLGLKDDQDEEDVLRDMRGKKGRLLDLLPDAVIGQDTPLFSILLPFRDANGGLQQWDLGNTMPFADWLSTRVENTEDGDPWFSRIARELMSGGPFTALAIEMMTNEDTFTRRRIWEDDMTTGEKTAAFAGHVATELAPPITPGLGTSYRMIAESLKRQPSKLAPLRSTAQAIVRGLGGLDVRPAEPNLYRQANEYRAEHGLPLGMQNVAWPKDAVGRARAELFKALIQPEVDVDAVARELGRLESLGKPVRTGKDIEEMFAQRAPETVMSRKAHQSSFIRGLAPESRRVMDAAKTEFNRARRAAPAALAAARKRRAEQSTPKTLPPASTAE